MSLRSFATSDDERVIAGVCAGIAQALGVDVTLVRLVFALLALAGGAGIALYLALWAYSSSGRAWWAAVLVLIAGSLLLHAVGLSDRAVGGIALVAAGFALAWRQGGSFRPGEPLSYGGLLLAGVGAVLLLEGGGATTTVLAPGAVAGALLLIGGPWLWRLALDRDAERSARIRSEERSEVAARVHDSVLQTLALIQRHAQEPRKVASLARRQERELRGWLYGEMPFGDESTSLVAALSAVAADVEEVHGVRVELASAGDCPADDALVLAAREAMTNAAKFAGVEEIDVYAEVTEDAVSVFVHDRGGGFDRAAVPADRRGLADSIEGRLERAGGTATIVTRPGEGTDVHAVKRRVVLVDDHELFLAGVRSELGDAVEVVGEAASVADAVPLIKELDPDVVLLDVHLPDGSGDAIINAVAPERPGVRFLALSVSDAAEDVIAVIRAGARGYVTKTISGADLAAAIERVAAGDAVFSPRLAGFVLDAFRAGERVGGDAELDELTPREREVLQLIARGYMYKEIATRLHLSVKTVESHVSNVLRKLQLSSRHELTRWATQHRLV
jgi:DNA-binding NarL/FixJ family response regulator/signal transduction histidine kinase